MSVLSHDRLADLDQAELQGSYAVIVNNVIAEGRESEIPAIVKSYAVVNRRDNQPRLTLVERIRDFLNQ